MQATVGSNEIIHLICIFHQDGGQDNGEELKDKRSWNKMQGAWGKRALSAMAAGYKRNWNNLRGAWGKREMPAALAKGQFCCTL